MTFLLMLWALVAVILAYQGHRNYSAWWVNIPFSLFWPLTLPGVVLVGWLGYFDDALEIEEE
jgi:hypothetical protein